jgi:hypothetical protein
MTNSYHGGYHFSGGGASKNFLEDITDRWYKTGLLKEAGEPGSEKAMCMATCLETQRRLNGENTDEKDISYQWKRLNVPLIVRIFRTCEAFKRNAFVNFFEDINMQSMLVFKTRFNPPAVHDHATNLDAEAHYLEEFSKGISRELETTFRDRRNGEIIFRGFTMLEDKTVIMYYA